VRRSLGCCRASSETDHLIWSVFYFESYHRIDNQRNPEIVILDLSTRSHLLAKHKCKSGNAIEIVICVLTASIIILQSACMSYNNDNLLAPYERSGRQFEKYELGDKIIYFYQRKIGDAVVEGDYINYQFDKNTKQLLAKKTQWRNDLPESLPPLAVTKEEATSAVKGITKSVELYFISPDSVVFPINPAPENPCWVIRTSSNIIIIDAVTGHILGSGLPPPAGN
jgi:hypothetical protein